MDFFEVSCVGFADNLESVGLCPSPNLGFQPLFLKIFFPGPHSFLFLFNFFLPLVRACIFLSSKIFIWVFFSLRFSYFFVLVKSVHNYLQEQFYNFVLKYLSDYLCHLGISICWLVFSMWMKIFLVLHIACNFGLYARHLNIVMTLWILFSFNGEYWYLCFNRQSIWLIHATCSNPPSVICGSDVSSFSKASATCNLTCPWFASPSG